MRTIFLLLITLMLFGCATGQAISGEYDPPMVVEKSKVITMINPKADIKKNYEENTSGILQATARDTQLITETKLPKV